FTSKMLFHKLILLLPTALLASAAPAVQNSESIDWDSIGRAGGPPPPDSKPPGALNSTAQGSTVPNLKTSSPCSGWYDFYGNGRWTYTEVQWCFRQDAKDTIITQEQRNPWYYWGGAWYTGKQHVLTWYTTGTVGGTRDFDSGKDWNDGPAKKDIYKFKTKIPSGIYAVSVHYHQGGPWWGESDGSAIDEDATFSISLGK
ncbi:hypothetical protein ACHAQJ_009968, partial [Trichoderma viride]